MKLNTHVLSIMFLVAQVLLVGCATNVPTTKDLECGQEKLEDRIVGFIYKKDSTDRFYEVNIQSSYTNKCNKPIYISKGSPYKSSSSVIYIRDDKYTNYSDDLYGCENNPDLCMMSPPIITANNVKEDRYYNANIEIDYIKLKPNQVVTFKLENILLSDKDKQKYFKAKTIYIVKKLYFGDYKKSYALGDEEIGLEYFNKNLYKDGGRSDLVWSGKKATLSKCTLQSEENGVRHYTCEFVKNVLKEEDKWAK